MKYYLAIPFFLITSVALVLSSDLGAQEGNYNFEHYGNQSSLLTGNAFASTTDLALSFYNPSRLSFTNRPEFIINVKAYQYNQFKFTSNFGGTNTSSNSQFRGLPSIVAGTFNLKFLPEHKFSYSFISRYRSNLNFGFNSGIIDGEAIDDSIDQAFLNLRVNDNLKDEWIGLTWSHKLNENFGIGISSFLSIYEFRSGNDIVVSFLDMNEEVLLSSTRLNFKQNTYGLFFKVGATWELDKVVLGANLSLPHLLFVNDASLRFQDFSSGFEGDDAFDYQSYNDLSSDRKTAFGIETGIEYTLGKHKIHGKFQWFSAVDAYERISLPDDILIDDIEQSQFTEEFRSVINFGLGAELFLTDGLSLIASFSSDYNAHVSSITILDQLTVNNENANIFADFWHYGLGADININWGNIVVGGTYSNSRINFNPDDAIDSSDPDDSIEGVLSSIKYQRYRLIVGIELPLFGEKLQKLKSGVE